MLKMNVTLQRRGFKAFMTLTHAAGLAPVWNWQWTTNALLA
jgi:hypothetical protein